DEIGELHPVQMNKLLKVLEDRKVILESAYYNPEDPNLPPHIKDMFENGLPADFRLVGATTRMPDEIPPAIRSRCLEVFFRQLTPAEVGIIARNAAERLGMPIEEGAVRVIQRYARNGREAVNMVQIAAGLADTEGRRHIATADAEWVVHSGQYAPRPERRVPERPQVGVANGLAVYGPNLGTVIEIEVVTSRAAAAGQGRITLTGIVDEEEFGGAGRPVKRRKSAARGSVENVLTALRRFLPVHPADYDLHINFPGGIPLDGPSAGATMAAAIYSAFTGIPVDNRVAITGEVTARGAINAVGGIRAKVEAAREAGARRVILPRENWQESLRRDDIEVVPVTSVEEVLREALVRDQAPGDRRPAELPDEAQVLTASPSRG
ncbi:MAG TPA: S16 family serine protease, partial [Thermaerobacter sp.]